MWYIYDISLLFPPPPPPPPPPTRQVKIVYAQFLYHCYIDTEVDNKETFTKDHLWDVFKSFSIDIHRVSISAP